MWQKTGFDAMMKGELKVVRIFQNKGAPQCPMSRQSQL